MPAPSKLSPVLIAGAGPAGLVAALTLMRNEIPVRIIEKSPKYNVGQRGPGIFPRSLELFNFLGVPEINEVGQVIPLIRRYRSGIQEVVDIFRMVPETKPTPAIPFYVPKLIGQQTLEGILRSHLEKLSCFVELETELRSFEQFPDHVTAHIVKKQGDKKVLETFEASWLIGTDGAKGVVRKGLNLPFVGETRDSIRVLIGDIRLTGVGIDRTHWHHFGTHADKKAANLRPTDEVGENGFQMTLTGTDLDPPKLLADNNELFAYISEATGADITFHEVVWASEFRPNIRMVNKFGEGRVFIAGDAAHAHSPTGGQGLNSSVQDSLNICWKLALVYKGLAPPSLLDTYTTERLPVITEMLQLTTAILNQASNQPESHHFHRGLKLFMLGVNYRFSPIVLDEFVTEARPINAYGILDEGRLEAGDRAPDAPELVEMKAGSGATTKLFDVYRPLYHTVLVFTPGVAQAESALSILSRYDPNVVRSVVVLPTSAATCQQIDSPADLVLADKEGHAYAAYLIKEGETRIVVVRPDGVVGAITRGGEGLGKYFDGIFEFST
ncbi:hypothetical protein BV22DRAFT_398881 [Leucogyrophana mollusca]|uniref:Uncharacterized protein n=1 Tax=Leucogyrophana mollusca TaxID=85980 RepID=A0ACB8BK68_9AGAM|nr:hypothetical protein BV22DRAFT_398881 [Leucogyrophana mollusca]